ncbi:PepSY domain-containing protein [Dehalobacter sp. DCM]|uniref:YcdB/YcdC domain-containing protein n=1 Tax=Dehalobacter sp. DCM TaxID=2907827 RepID=UPI003081D5A1|nr:PepSY domain-containing protein [Dehalobacter sp. DCM]
MSNKKWIILPLVFLLIIQIPFPLFGSEKAVTADSTPKISLEQALTTVKSNFSIPVEYTEFSSGFNSNNTHYVWYLNWNAPGGSGGSFSAQVDASSGEILSINSWQTSQNDQSFQLPALTHEEARQIASSTVKRLTGQKFSHLQYIQETNLVPLNPYGSATYEFRWQRVENGVPFQGNLATIQINADTGKVTSYTIVWSDLAIPAVKNIISAQKAMDAFQSAKLLELQYFLTPIYKPLIVGTNNENVQLIYQIKNNGTIDAFSGQALNISTDQWLFNGRGAGNLSKSTEDTAQAVVLTPEEQKELAANAKLLTRDQAIAVAQKWITLPSTLTLRSINLSQDYYQRNGKVWSFEWGSSSGDSLAQSISARINAENGDVLSFNIYNPSSSQTGTKITAEQAKIIAENFIKKIAPSKFDQLKLSQDPVDKDSNMESTSLLVTYERIVNGISFPSNNISINVDLLTGKISSYNLTWWNLDFPQLSLAISQSEAQNKLFASRPMILQYVVRYELGEAKEVRLVYQPSTENKLTSDRMDAKTGAFIDFQGNPMKQQPQPHRFIDIAGHPAEKEITLLGLAGLFGEYGTKFEPSKNITAISLLRALNAAKNGSESSLSDDEIIKLAKEQGWVKESIVPSQSVNRLLYCKIMTRYLGLEKIAMVSDIYHTSYTDIAKDTQGYVSLITGMGIIKADGTQFDPNASVSRSEAAAGLIKALEVGFRN